MQGTIEYNKIYYYFAYDPKNIQELKFRFQREVGLQFIRSLLVSMHGIESAAMCFLQICKSDQPNIELGFDEKIPIGSKLIIRRVPTTKYKNGLKNIIECFENKDTSRIKLDKLGVSLQELEEVIKDNTGQYLKDMLDDLKQKYMIQDEQLVTQQQQQVSAKLFLGTRSKQAKIKTNLEQRNEESASDDMGEGAQQKKQQPEAVRPFNQWLYSGQIFKKQ